jgi:hypothetical protein
MRFHMHLYAILYVGVNRAYMGTRQRMMLFARKRLLEHLRVRLVGLLDGKLRTGMNLFIIILAIFMMPPKSLRFIIYKMINLD